jgi:hypothetical protein
LRIFPFFFHFSPHSHFHCTPRHWRLESTTPTVIPLLYLFSPLTKQKSLCCAGCLPTWSPIYIQQLRELTRLKFNSWNRCFLGDTCVVHSSGRCRQHLISTKPRMSKLVSNERERVPHCTQASELFLRVQHSHLAITRFCPESRCHISACIVPTMSDEMDTCPPQQDMRNGS